MGKPFRGRTTTKMLALVVPVLLVVTGCGDGASNSEQDDQAADEPTDDVDGAVDGSGEEDGDAVEDLGTVRVGYFAVAASAPLYLTAEKYAEQVGLTVEMTPLPTGPEILTSVATGQFDVGNPGFGAYVYNAHVEGLPFELVSYQHMDAPEPYWVFSSEVVGSQEEAEELANDLSSVAGETFATVTPGGSTTYMLDVLLERGGLALDDVQVDYMPFPDMAAAISSGAVVAGTLPEPLASRVVGEGGGYRALVDEAEHTEPAPLTVLAFNSDWSGENPEAAEAFMTAFQMAVDELERENWQSDEILDIIASYTEIPAEVMRDTVPSTMPVDLSVDLDLLRQMQQFFLDTDTLNYDELMDDEELWNFEWRDRALEGS